MRPALALPLLLSTALLLTAACGGGDSVVFTHGVASGDVLPSSAILWTRVDREAELAVELALDPAFDDVVLDTVVEATADADFTASVELGPLEPGLTYYYRFRHGDALSPTGSFRAAPAVDDPVPVRFVFSGDTDGTVDQDGTRPFDFRVLETMLAEDADFFLYIGDTIYADSSFGDEARTLNQYRAKYRENREVELIARTLSSMSAYAIWDDHEVHNNFAGTTVNPVRLVDALQAFREYFPLAEGPDPRVLYRSFRWGSAVDLIFLDGRTFRDPDVADQCIPDGAGRADVLPGLGAPGLFETYGGLRAAVGLDVETDPDCLDALNDPARTMLGDEQKRFLLNALRDSDAMFTFVITPLPIQEIIAEPYDRWEGYRAERDEIIRFIEDEGIDNVIFLATDFHANFIGDVRVDLDSDPVAVEAITGPIAHATLGDAIEEQQGPAVIAVYEQLLKEIPRVECIAIDAFSYGLVEVDPAAGTTTITLKDEDGTVLCEKVVEAD